MVELPRTITAQEVSFEGARNTNNTSGPDLTLCEFLDGSEEEDLLDDDWDEESLPLYQVSETSLEESKLGEYFKLFHGGT